MALEDIIVVRHGSIEEPSVVDDVMVKVGLVQRPTALVTQSATDGGEGAGESTPLVGTGTTDGAAAVPPPFGLESLSGALH